MTVRIAHNLKFLAQHTAGGAPNLGEGMAMKIKDGRRYMYIAHEHGPAAFSIFDVTEPSDPKITTSCDPPPSCAIENARAVASFWSPSVS